MKKTLWTIGVVLVLVGSGYLVLTSLDRTSFDEARGPLSGRFSDALGARSNEGIQKIENARGDFLTRVNEQTIRYYESQGGLVYEWQDDGASSPTIVSTISPKASNISWSPDGLKLYASYSDHTQYVNTVTGVQTRLDGKISQVRFGLDGQKSAYIYFNPETQQGSISIADPLFQSFKTILNTRVRDWHLTWITADIIGILSTPLPGQSTRTLSLLNTETGALTSLISNKNSLEANFSPSGTRMVYSVLNPRTQVIELHFVDLHAQRDIKTKLSTRASKCTWTQSEVLLYCGVPQEPITNEKRNLFTQDNIVRISIVDGTPQSEVIADTNTVDVAYPVLLSGERLLVFTNEQTHSLYSLAL